jgi:hypothetical protein
MRTFKDNEGREWQVRIDVNAVRSVRSELDVNLLALPDQEFALLTRLTTDLVLLVDVLYVVCRKQAQDRSISDEEFGRSMYGDCIQNAADALIRETIDFFPDARRRAMLSKVIDKGKALGDLLMNKGMDQAQRLDEIDLETEATKMMKRLTENAPTGSAGSMPASPESIQVHSLSPS